MDNLVVKMDALLPGGSHKARAAWRIVDSAVAAGEIGNDGDRRIIEKTGGNSGLGLAYAGWHFGVGVDLVVGLSFSPVKRALCERFGARLVGLDALKAGATPKEVIADLLAAHGDAYHFTDQFSNPGNVLAHQEETGPELVAQIEALVPEGDRPIVLVKGAGTGASAAGVVAALRQRFNSVSLVIVHPHNCDPVEDHYEDHRLEGIFVGVRPPFLDYAAVDEFRPVRLEQALEGQASMARMAGCLPGLTSGACFHVALNAARARPEALVVTMAYDAGETDVAREAAETDSRGGWPRG